MKKIAHVNREKIVTALELPKDLLLGVPYLHLTGNRELLIENHKGILSCSDEQMVILAKQYAIDLKGRNLYVEYYNADSMKIIGDMEELHFQI